MKKSEISRLFPSVDPATISLLPVLDQFHEGIIITDAQGIVLYMNDTQAMIDDLEADDAIGKKVTDLYRVDEGASPTMTCLNTGKAIQNFACYYRTHLGRIVNSIHNVYPIHADGRIIGTICYITDYKNIEQSFTTVGKTRHALRRCAYFDPPNGVKRVMLKFRNDLKIGFRDKQLILYPVSGCDICHLCIDYCLLFGESNSPAFNRGSDQWRQ
jgi:arginine utilization regulatory protein